MSPRTTVKVTISGIELSFKTEDPQYIKELARHVEDEVRKVLSTGKVTSATKAVTLAAFNVADELFTLRKEKDELANKLSERLDAMLDMAEDAHRPTQPRSQQ
jgi:cell division protein ZapA (FtsZ GTPase activity inhibitor)